MTKTAIRDTLTSEDFANAGEPDGWGTWSKTDELLAVLADRVSWLTWLTSAINAEKGKAPPQPEPIRRPGIGKSGSELRTEKQALVRKQQISAAHAAYAMAHDGAYPPPGWDHGVPDDDL